MNATGPARGATFVELVDFSDVEPVSKTLWPGERYDYVSPGCNARTSRRAFPDPARARPGAAAMALFAQGRAAYLALGRAQPAPSRHRRARVDEASRALQQRAAHARPARAGDRLPLRLVDRASRRRRARTRRDRPGPRLSRPDARRRREPRARRRSRCARKLWAGFSPSIVPAVRATAIGTMVVRLHRRLPRGPRAARRRRGGQRPDGGRRAGDVSRSDLAACRRRLRAFRGRGLEVGLYNTMQIMGLAWRGRGGPVGMSPTRTCRRSRRRICRASLCCRRRVDVLPASAPRSLNTRRWLRGRTPAIARCS